MLFVLALVIPTTSCGAVGNYAKDWWEANKDGIIASTADAAGTYWNENKDELLAKALDGAKNYTDEKFQAQKDATISKLLEKGYTLTDMDADNDGIVSDDELADFLKSNPMALWYAGAGGVGLLAMYYGKQLMRKFQGQAEVVSTPPPTPTPPLA